MFDSAAVGIRKWLVGLFVQAIGRSAHPEDRHAAIVWLLRSREILAAGLGPADTLKALDDEIGPRGAVSDLAGQVAAAVMGYRTADVPWAVKIAIPPTLLAAPVDGWPVFALQGAGMAAFGRGIGLPALLLVNLGAAGITAVVEGVVATPQSAAGIALVAARILREGPARPMAGWVAEAMVDDPEAPCAAAMPKEGEAVRAALLALPPGAFERHVMSFFEKAGLEAVVTPRAKERGLDGYARHPRGPIVVQCRRYGPEHRVGGPAIPPFRTVMADAAAWRGYVVTTSCFTAGAVSCAMKEEGLVLVDGDALVRWHTRGFAVAE